MYSLGATLEEKALEDMSLSPRQAPMFPIKQNRKRAHILSSKIISPSLSPAKRDSYLLLKLREVVTDFILIFIMRTRKRQTEKCNYYKFLLSLEG